MIKWLSASRLKNGNQCEPTPLTNDPLAAIAGVNDPDGKCQIYAVTRWVRRPGIARPGRRFRRPNYIIRGLHKTKQFDFVALESVPVRVLKITRSSSLSVIRWPTLSPLRDYVLEGVRSERSTLRWPRNPVVGRRLGWAGSKRSLLLPEWILSSRKKGARSGK